MALPALDRTDAPVLSLNFLGGALDGRVAYTRAGSATYVDAAGTIQTVGANVPRFNYDPTTHLPQGLLVEAARTNFLLNSGAPATQTTGSLGVGTYTLWLDGTGSAAVTAGTATLTGNGTASSGVKNTFNVTIAGTVTVTVTGSPTRFQLEQSSGRTSYMPTAGAIAGRSADVANVTLGAWFKPAAFTVVSSWIFPYVPGDPSFQQGAWQMDDGTGNNFAATFEQTAGTLYQSFMASGGVTGVNNAAGYSLTAGVVRKHAFAAQAGDFAAYAAGVQQGTQSAGVVMPVGLTTLRIGQTTVGVYQFNGTIQTIDVYDRRLPNTVLAALTA